MASLSPSSLILFFQRVFGHPGNMKLELACIIVDVLKDSFSVKIVVSYIGFSNSISGNDLNKSEA